MVLRSITLSVLYNIVRRKTILVADVLTGVPLNIKFRRTITGNNWEVWLLLLQRLIPVNLKEDLDIFVSKLNTSGTLCVKSMYANIMNGRTIFLNKYIWKIKVPLKIKIFMWFLYKNVILAKANLTKRKWNGSKKCVLCDSEESINHLFFNCPFARLIYRTIQFTFNITPPANVTNMFGNWLTG
jgi:hypothetical protein